VNESISMYSLYHKYRTSMTVMDDSTHCNQVVVPYKILWNQWRPLQNSH